VDCFQGQQEPPASGREVAEAALTTAAADLFSGSCAGAEQQTPARPAAKPAEHELEFMLENVIPFLATEALGMSLCGRKPGRTSVTMDGKHVHTWCETCSFLPNRCLATHESCEECVALRTMSLLSQRWVTFCWDGLASSRDESPVPAENLRLVPGSAMRDQGPAFVHTSDMSTTPVTATERIRMLT
jgi:hypothetical protein